MESPVDHPRRLSGELVSGLPMDVLAPFLADALDGKVDGMFWFQN